MRRFHLTRRAFMDLEDVYTLSVEQWGTKVAQKYLRDIYQCFQKIADLPEIGSSRQVRSEPFLMYPARKHFVIYEKFKESVVIATILHQVRDIESILQELGSAFREEIEQLKKSIAE